MTATEVLYLPGAIDDLIEIEWYISSVASAEVASNYVDRLKEYIETFSSYPEAGHRLPEIVIPGLFSRIFQAEVSCPVLV